MSELKQCKCEGFNAEIEGPFLENKGGWCVFCPDCGQAHPFIEIEDFFKIGWRYYVWCPSCNKESDLYETKEQAIDAWNKRS